MNVILKKSHLRGFTIVELLIVVVVIAILAAITIVAYNGINTRARQSSMQSTVVQLSKEILNYRTVNGSFPSSLSVLNNGQGPKTGTDAQYAYTGTSSSYCVTIGSLASQDTYYISDTEGKVQTGLCPGHTSSAFQGYPGRGGFINVTTTYNEANNSLSANISAIPNGSWMLAVFAHSGDYPPIPPAGWTTLMPQKTTGTLETNLFAKIKDASDSSVLSFVGGEAYAMGLTNGAILWGTGAAPVSSWTIGTYGDRGINATTTTVVTPTISVLTAKSLVLSIATERTTADEANYTSLTGATPWAWVPQNGTSQIQTIAVGYNEQQSTGTSQPMTVTYPNSQTVNGTGIQVAIPPAS